MNTLSGAEKGSIVDVLPFQLAFQFNMKFYIL
jgi:hypothetical protein